MYVNVSIIDLWPGDLVILYIHLLVPAILLLLLLLLLLFHHLCGEVIYGLNGITCHLLLPWKPC